MADLENIETSGAIETAISEHFNSIQTNFDFELALVGANFWMCPPLSPGDLLPSYSFRRQLFPSTPAADFLMKIAEGAQAAERGDIVVALCHGALAFDDRCFDALILLAEAIHRVGDLSQAIVFAQKAVERDPDSARANVLLGRLHLEAKQPEQANAVLGPFLARIPNAEGFWYRGNALVTLGYLGQAEAHFRAVIALAPAFPDAKIALSDVLARQGRVPEAMEAALQAVAVVPHPAWMIQIADLLARSNYPREAQSILEPLLAEAPDTHVARCLLAGIYGQQGDHARADEVIEAGLSLAPDEPSLWLGRCTVARQSGQAARAAMIATEITDRWPAYAEGWHLRGLLFLDQGEVETARGCFARALRNVPASIPSGLAQAEAALSLGDRAGALWQTDQLLHFTPGLGDAQRLKVKILLADRRLVEAGQNLAVLFRAGGARQDPRFWLLLADLFRAQGRLPAALLAVRRALRLSPADANALYRGTKLALQIEDAAEALRLGQLFLQLHPEAAGTQAIASALFLGMGEIEEAGHYAEHAIVLAPSDPDGWFLLGCVRRRQGRLAEAEEALSQARTLAIDRADILLELAEVLAADHRPAERRIALKLACELAPKSAKCWLALAEALERDRDLLQAVGAARRAHALAPRKTPVTLCLARLLFLQGQAEECWALLAPLQGDPEGQALSFRLAAMGFAPGRAFLRSLTRADRYRLQYRVLETLAAAGNAAEYCAAAFLAKSTFPEDAAIGLAFIDSRKASVDADSLARETRQWVRRRMLAAGTAPHYALPPRVYGNRLRIAYLAARYQASLLDQVLLDHDQARVELHLYTDDWDAVAPEVRTRVTLHRLSEGNLARSFIANAIEVAVDTGGFTPWGEQVRILTAFCRRLAPLQCLWSITQSEGAGLYDLVLPADPLTVAASLEEAAFAQRATDQAWWQLPNPKDRNRAIARRSFAAWEKGEERLSLPAPEAPDVSIVLVLYNQVGLTLECLKSIADQQGVSFETILIDNASSDETGLLLDRIDGAQIVRNADNIGFLEAANQGAALARGRHVLFLNTDALLQEHALTLAVARIESDAQIAVVGARIVLADGTLQEAGCMLLADGWSVGYGRGQSPDLPEFRFVRDVECVSGAFLLIRRSIWQALGGFDPIYGPAYYEDTDFCLRARRGGFKIVYDPDILVSHLEWGSAVDPNYSRDNMTRNRPIFRSRHEAALSGRPDIFTYDPLRQRSVADPAPNLLVLDDAVPVGAPQARIAKILTAIDQYHVTFLPMLRAEEEWSDVYAALPKTIEVIVGCGADGLENFLEQRLGHYACLLVHQAHNIELVAALKDRRPALFEGIRVIYDMGAGKVISHPAALQADRLIAAASPDLGGVEVGLLKAPRPLRAQAPGFAQREGLVFIGPIDPGTPDEDGALWFAHVILPKLNEVLGHAVPVTLVGPCRSDIIRAQVSSQIRLVETTTDLSSVLDQARLLIAPARLMGGGAPFAIEEALVNGLPVVASHLAARRQGWVVGIDLLAPRTADAFVAAVADLYRSPDHWQKFQTAGLEWAATHLSADTFARTLRDALQCPA